MPIENYILFIYIICINIAAFVIFGLDKLFAIKHRWRISETTLILLCAVGGSIGGLLGMEIFRHKTKHAKFKFGVPAILLIQVILIVFAVYKI